MLKPIKTYDNDVLHLWDVIIADNNGNTNQILIDNMISLTKLQKDNIYVLFVKDPELAINFLVKQIDDYRYEPATKSKVIKQGLLGRLTVSSPYIVDVYTDYFTNRLKLPFELNETMQLYLLTQYKPKQDQKTTQ